MFLSEGKEAVYQIERLVLEEQETILEVETQVAGNLVVAGASGVKAFSRRANAPSEPVLDSSVNVFVFGTDPKSSSIDLRQRRAQTGSNAAVFGRREQLRCAETLDVTQTSEDIPGEEPGIPEPVLDGGVIEQLAVQ